LPLRERSLQKVASYALIDGSANACLPPATAAPITPSPAEIDALAKLGYLELKDRDDVSAIEGAASAFISDSLTL